MALETTPQSQSSSPEDAAAKLLQLIREFVAGTRPQRVAALTLDSALERDLGIDSLGRAELLLRVEQAFNCVLPERALTEIETPRDLLRYVLAVAAPSAQVEQVVSTLSVASDAGFPDQAATLIDVIDWHAARHPQRVQIHVHGEGDTEEDISYAALKAGAEAVAAELIERGLQPGQTVAIMLPTSRDYFFSFYGILMAGGVPVPIYPPTRLSQLEDHMRRHAGILANAQAVMLITVAEAKAVALVLRSQIESLRGVLTAADFAQGRALAHRPRPAADDLAFLQYTSGSTGNPKGVMLSHANLLANVRAMGRAANVASADVFVSWLPLYHDMGLIGAWLGSLYHGFPLAVMSPLAFLARPHRWLWAIHRHRGTMSGAPNFAYELCARKIDDRHLKGLDLSSWRFAFNGAEPVSTETLTAFRDRFAPYGLRPEAIAPVYGLAECSVGLAFPPPNRAPLIERIQRNAFTSKGQALIADENDADALRLIGCGMPLHGHEVRIVNATGYEAGERQVGRLQFKGPSATRGYYRNAEETAKLFDGEWLNSGDQAYVANGEIFLTGRAKDVIIRGGRNIYPYDLEQAVGELPGMRRGCVCVFGSPDLATGTERLIVLAETRVSDSAQREEMLNKINELSIDLLGMPPDDVMLAPPHTVLKTSSGKLRRTASREVYERGGRAEKPAPVWQQFMRLSWSGVLPQTRRMLRACGELLYAGYAWLVFALLAPGVWLAVALVRKPAFGRAVIHYAGQLMVRLIGARVTAQGVENLPRTPAIIVMNHTSYLDGMFLATVLPPAFAHAYIVKREFASPLIPRLFFAGIGAEFVERFDAKQGLEDVEQASKVLRGGASLVFFPEGTFVRQPGLLPFRMGAFALAARAGVAVTPITIRGARAMLVGDNWFPRHGAVQITIGAPLVPDGVDWDAAVRLRDATRVEILRGCGEPDLV
jgi:acyl carrier protein